MTERLEPQLEWIGFAAHPDGTTVFMRYTDIDGAPLSPFTPPSAIAHLNVEVYCGSDREHRDADGRCVHVRELLDMQKAMAGRTVVLVHADGGREAIR